MKKFIFFLVIILLPAISHAQLKIGLKLSPALNFNRIQTESDSLETESEGIRIRGLFGIFADFQFSENYYFNTGLLYVPKVVGVKVTDLTDGVISTARYNVEYIQIPIDLKLFTDEIALDKRLYFQVGVTVDISMKETIVEGYDPMISKFKPLDITGMFGGGLEVNVSKNTRLFAGLIYYRGLLNVVDSSTKNVIIKTDIIALDLGVKF
ncbi:porin family protein [Bacteroidota bacterium]